MVHKIVVRHGNVTSFLDVFLMSFLFTLCSSISVRFKNYVLRKSIFSFQCSTNHLHRVASSSLVVGLVTLRGIAEGYLISHFSCTVHDFRTTRILGWSKVNASLLCRCVQYEIFLRFFICGFALIVLRHS